MNWLERDALQVFAWAQTGPWSLHVWGLIVLAFAIVIGLLKNRRASVAVGFLIVALIVAHTLRTQAWGDPWLRDEFIGLFAFTPARYLPGSTYDLPPGGLLAALWSPFTYTFLHADGSHLFGNCVALFVFGRSVAWRLGTWRFLLFFFAAGAAGAFGHLVVTWADPIYLAGASASTFGIMAATFRFVPQVEDPLKALFWPDEKVRNVALASPLAFLSKRRSLVYALICLIIYPLGLIALILGTAGDVAVAAHICGFGLGLFGFGWFDRKRPGLSPAVAVAEPTETKPTELLGLRLLRVAFLILILIGIVTGLMFYYLPHLFYF